jgi:hypothetical protein
MHQTSCKLLMTTSVPWGSDCEWLCPLQNPTLLLRGRYKYGGASTYSNKPGSRETCFHSWCHHTAHIVSTPGATLQHILLPLLVPPYGTYCFHSWCHLTAHIASTPGATIQHILLPLLVPPYSTYCFHSWCHLTAYIASTPGATIQHILLPLLVPLWWSQIRPVQDSSKHISRMRAHAQWPLLSVLTRSDVVATAYVMPGSRFG